MLLQANDLVVVSESDLAITVRSKLHRWVRDYKNHYEPPTTVSRECRMLTTGNNRIDLTKVRMDVFEGSELSEAELHNTTKWLISSYAYADYIIKNPELFLPLFNNDTEKLDIKFKGIMVRWLRDDLRDSFGVDRKKVTALVEGTLEEVPNLGTSKLYYRFIDPKLNNNYIGDASTPMLQRAYHAARRQLVSDFYTSFLQVVNADSGELWLASYLWNDGATIPLQSFDVIRGVVKTYSTPPSIELVRNQRAAVLERQREMQSREETVRKQLAAQNFSQYWEGLKTRVRDVVPTVEVAAEQFKAVPLQPQGTPSSRTWGIEVETVRAHLTSRPAGWESEYDGSLTGSDDSGSCNCSCDYCYDSDHCNDRDNDCYDDDTGDYEAREFVSPVLDSFNSRGLQSLCSDLPTKEDNTTPGIHVHVGAQDLTVTDVARLLVAYSAIAPLLRPLYHRQVENYCKEMQTNNLAWWLSAARKYVTIYNRVPLPSEICHDQPADRYQDVNLEALSKHGTIEFRAMGPFYDYDHLVRWAWLVREMVNVSKLGLPQTTWTRCRSLTDVINVLRKYGVEAPLDKQFDAVDTRSLSLSEQ